MVFYGTALSILQHSEMFEHYEHLFCNVWARAYIHAHAHDDDMIHNPKYNTDNNYSLLISKFIIYVECC